MKIKCIHNFIAIFIVSAILTACVPHAAQTDDDSTQKKISAANANIELGMDYLQQNDVVIAKEKLLAALELAPKYPPAWYTMGYYLEVTGESKKAGEYYLHAISLAPNNGDVQNNYGTFLCHTGKPKESIEHFLKATQDPKYVDTAAAYENAGLCALLIPDVKSAKIYFTKAVTQDPRRTRSAKALAELEHKKTVSTKNKTAAGRGF